MTKQTTTRSGFALVMSALLCLGLVPLLGLAIDSSISYMMRLKLSTAVDAAITAGARSLNQGQTISDQAAAATAVAQTIFNANMPSTGNWGVQNISSAVSVGQNDATHYRWVTVTASADVPSVFLGLIGFHTTHIGFSGTAQRRDLNMVLVLDHSGSMAGVVSTMQADAISFVNMFANGRDKVGLVTFAGTSYLAYAPSSNFLTDSPNIPSLIGQMTTYNGATNTSQAVWMAYQQLLNLNSPGALNVIVVFTDGLANTFTADFASYIAPAAGCNVLSPLNGVLMSDTSGSSVYGLSDPTANSLNDATEGRPAPNSNGCGNISNNWSVANYLTGLPVTDSNGNSTNGTGSIGAYVPVNVNQVTGQNVTNAGLNAFDDAANRVRSNTTLKPIIYTIGLGNNPGLPPDQVLLARVANSPDSAFYNSAQAPGLSVFSPTVAQLHAAFLRVASEILRISQ